MSAQAQNIISQIDRWVRNYAPAAFHDLHMNAILKQLALLADSGTGGGVNQPPVRLTSANFTTATDCPLIALSGRNIAVFFNETGKYLEKDLGEWTDLPGGGFSVSLPGFDATTAVFHFYVFVL